MIIVVPPARPLHVRVWIDATGHDELPARVDDGCVARCVDAFAHGCDDAIFAKYVRT
jgi:hypothetical protein